MLCLNLFRINMIRIDTILNMSRLEIKTWRNTLKFEQIAQRMFGDKVIPWIAASKSSDQKHVGTCHKTMIQFYKHVLTCLNNDMIWYDSVNMSGLVIILWPFDMILQTCSVLHYKLINFSELVWTCLNLSELVWTCLWRFLNMSKLVQNQLPNMSRLVQNQYDMNWYNS